MSPRRLILLGLTSLFFMGIGLWLGTLVFSGKTPKKAAKNMSIEEWNTFSPPGFSMLYPSSWRVETVSDQTSKLSDDTAKSQAGAEFKSIRVIFSAQSPTRASATTFPASFSVVQAIPRAAKGIDNGFVKDAVEGLRADYPAGAPTGRLESYPAGPAAVLEYVDQARVGPGQDPKKTKTVDVFNVQVAFSRGEVRYLLNFTGPSNEKDALRDLATEVAQGVRLGS